MPEASNHEDGELVVEDVRLRALHPAVVVTDGVGAPHYLQSAVPRPESAPERAHRRVAGTHSPQSEIQALHVWLVSRDRYVEICR